MRKRDGRDSIVQDIFVLDGGMASELEYLGANINGPLWSAHVLEDQPEKVIAVHRAYIEAGADCIETASYQVSRRGYSEFGFAPEQADAALLRSVALARAAASEFPERQILVAASLGPFGAVLHNGAEYHGNYSITFRELVDFHRERIEILAMRPTSVPRRESGCNDPFTVDISELLISDRIRGAGACAVRTGLAIAQAASHPQIRCRQGFEKSFINIAILLD